MDTRKEKIEKKTSLGKFMFLMREYRKFKCIWLRMNKSDELSGTFDAISKANFTGRNVSDVEEAKIPSHYESKCLKWFTTYLT